MTPQEMRALYDYNAWANHRSLDAACTLTAEKFVQPMGSSFGSVRDTLAHISGPNGFGWNGFRGVRRLRFRIPRNSKTWRVCGSAGTSTKRDC